MSPIDGVYRGDLHMIGGRVSRGALFIDPVVLHVDLIVNYIAFTGDHTLAKWFVWELNIYFWLNKGCNMIDNLIKKTLLALGFLKDDGRVS